MGTITTSDGTELFYKDWGAGQPVVFTIHGDDDQIVPIDVSARRSVQLVNDATLKVYPGAPTACSPPTKTSSTPARLPQVLTLPLAPDSPSRSPIPRRRV